MASLIDVRIKYYSRNDVMNPIIRNMAVKYYLDKYSTKTSYSFENINDLLELFNVLKYFKDFNSKTLTNLKVNLEDLGKNFKSAVGRYFNNIKSEDELKEIIKSIENQYRDDLILIFSQFSNVTKKFLTDDVIIFLCENSYLQYILDNKNFLNSHRIREHNSYVLKSYLFSHIESFPFYLSKDLVNSNDPFNFSSKEFNSLVDKYIHLHKGKIYLNSLDLILKNKLLSKNIRYLVCKFKDDLIKERVSFTNIESVIKLVPQDEISKFETNEGEFSYCFSYDLKWLKKFIDFPSILNNFKYVFNLVDYNNRISFTSAPLYRKKSIFEIFNCNKQKLNEFDSNDIWDNYFISYILKTRTYCSFLKDLNIYLEDVIDWFFSDYIKKEFSIDNFIVNIKAAKNLESYSDKIKLLLPEFESIFKQFEAYCEFNYVNHDYVSISLSIGENSYPESLIKPEITYVEKNDSDDAKKIFNELFHEDYRLKGHRNLFDFLKENKKGFDSQLLSELYTSFNLLLKNKILFQDANGVLLADMSKLSLLEQVEDYGYLCYNFLNDVYQKDVNDLLNCNLLTSYNSFMSKQENDLFNFVFNNKFSNNPLGLRNLYLHGNPSLNENEHESNYFISLTMMIVLVLKLNDAFTIMTNKDHGKRRFNNVFEEHDSIVLT